MNLRDSWDSCRSTELLSLVSCLHKLDWNAFIVLIVLADSISNKIPNLILFVSYYRKLSFGWCIIVEFPIRKFCLESWIFNRLISEIHIICVFNLVASDRNCLVCHCLSTSTKSLKLMAFPAFMNLINSWFMINLALPSAQGAILFTSDSSWF